MNDQKFLLWQAIFSLIHLDKKIAPEEEKWVKEKLDSLPLEERQRSTLLKNFNDKVSVTTFLDKITNKIDRAFLLHQVRVISHLDNDYSEKERDFFDQLQKQIVGDASDDLEKLCLEVEKELRADDIDNKYSFFEKAYKNFLRIIHTDK